MDKKRNETKENEEKELGEFLTKVVEEGGSVNKWENPDGTVRALTVTTRSMKESLLKTRPSVIQIDTTHNVESSGFKLSAVVYYHPVTGKGEIGQLAFIEDESKDVYSFVFKQFRQLMAEDPPAILIDKGSSLICGII